jgi:hypothetical protein
MKEFQLNKLGKLCITNECQNVGHATAIIIKNVAQCATKMEGFVIFSIRLLCKYRGAGLSIRPQIIKWPLLIVIRIVQKRQKKINFLAHNRFLRLM